METQQLTKTAFAQTLKSAGNETYQTVFENEVWYEQITVGEVIYRHKLLSLRKLSSELINKKTLKTTPSCEPIRLRAQNGGPVVAYVCNTKTTVFYHLLVSSKSEMIQAKRLVAVFAKSLLPKTTQPQLGKHDLSLAA